MHDRVAQLLDLRPHTFNSSSGTMSSSEQAPNLAQWNIKGWSGVGSGDAYNGSAVDKLLSV